MRKELSGRVELLQGTLDMLIRLERKGWIAAKWEPARRDLKREFKYYRLTATGRAARGGGIEVE